MPEVKRRRGRPAKRKKAPDMTEIDEVYKDEAKELVKWAKAKMVEAGVDVSKLHFTFGDPNTKPELYKRKGLTPVIIEGELINDRGDPLLTRSLESEMKRRRVAALLSAEQTRGAMDGDDPKYSTRDATGEVYRLEKGD